MSELNAALAGLLAGILGIIPFAHTNLILEFATQFFTDGLHAAFFAVSLSFSHLVFEIIPVLWLGLPTQNQGAVSVVGAGSNANEKKQWVELVSIVFFKAFIYSILLAPAVFLITPFLFQATREITGFVMLALIAILLWRENKQGSFTAASSFAAFLASGLVGTVSLVIPVSREPLFPLLTGLFGLPVLLIAEKIETPVKIGKVDEKLVFASCVFGLFSSLLPALSPALVAGLVLMYFTESKQNFLVTASAVLVSKMLGDFLAVFSLQKARSAAAAVVLDGVNPLGTESMVLLLSAGAAAFLISWLAVKMLGEKLAKYAPVWEKPVVTRIAVVLVSVGVLVVSGVNGFLILAASASLGCAIRLLGIKQSWAMGCLIIPSLLYFFNASNAVLSFVF